MATDIMLSLEEKVDLYRAIRGTYWTYQLSAYEEAAIKGFLPVVEEAGKRMHAKVEELSKRGKEGSWQTARAGQVEREMERLTAALNADLTGSVTAASGTVGSAAVKEYNDILSVGGAIKTSAIALSPSQFASYFTESLPVMIPKVITSMLDKAGLADMQRALVQEMQVGALTGASYDRMVKDLRQRFPELMRNELTTMTRTFFQTANARAFDRVYKENADILVGKTWISANDDRVCLMCLPLGGKTFYKGEAHPPMPRHPRCRCLFIPKTKSLKKLGVDVKKVEKTVDPVILRGRMKDGKWYIPQVGTGGAAPGKPFTVLPGGLRAGFTSMPEEVQLSMLGKGRHEMLKSGLIKIDDLIDYKSGKLYTLDELYTRASSPALTKSAPIKKATGVKPLPKPSTATMRKELGAPIFEEEGKKFSENLLPQKWMPEGKGMPDTYYAARSLDEDRYYKLLDETLESDGRGDSKVMRLRLNELHTFQSTVETDRTLAMAKAFSEAEYKKEGLPVVYRVSDGTYLLKDGNHRVNAALLAGHDSLEFEVYDLYERIAAKKAADIPDLPITPPVKKKMAVPDPWDDLAYEDPDRFPTELSAPWGDLRDEGARRYFLDRAKRGSGTINELLRQDHLDPIYRVASDARYKLGTARYGFWASDSKDFAFLDEGMIAEFRGTEIVSRGLGGSSLEKAASYGKHVFKIEVPPGMHVAAADGDRLIVLPGARFDVKGVTTLHGREVAVLTMTDDGSAYVKGLAKYWDDVEEAAHGPEARVFTKAGDTVAPLKPAVAPSPPKPGTIIKTQAGIEITELQKEAIDYATLKAANVEDEILDMMAERYSVDRDILDKQYAELKKQLLRDDKYEFAFNTEGSPAMWKSLEKEGKFKNQFELGRKASSGGSLCPYKDSSRDAWEKNMYGGIFQKRKEYRAMNNREYFTPDVGRERPFYGYMHDSGAVEAGAGPFTPGTRQYGEISFVLDKKRMLDRTSFTVGNSSGYWYTPGSRRPLFTAKNPISLFDAMYENAQYETKTVAAKIKKMDALIKAGKGVSGLQEYTEAQFIGGLTLDDVKVVMIPNYMKVGPLNPEDVYDIGDLISTLEKKKIPYAFHETRAEKGASAAASRKAAKEAVEAAAKEQAALAAKKAAEEAARKAAEDRRS